MQEVWKDIKGYEGKYQVSNLGNVKSLNYHNTKSEKVLINKTQNKGYKYVFLYKNNSPKFATVHRLVAMTFIPNPRNLPEVNHKDENPANNRVDNLEWCTYRENWEHSNRLHPEYNEKLKKVIKNTTNKRNSGNFGGYKNKQKIRQLTIDGKVVNEYKDSAQAARENNYSSRSIIACCKEERKTAYGFRWEFVN